MAMCNGKRGWETSEQADRVLDEIRKKKSGDKQKPVRHYKCPICEKHHLTHLPFTTVSPARLKHAKEFRKYL